MGNETMTTMGRGIEAGTLCVFAVDESHLLWGDIIGTYIPHPKLSHSKKWGENEKNLARISFQIDIWGREAAAMPVENSLGTLVNHGKPSGEKILAPVTKLQFCPPEERFKKADSTVDK